MKTTSWSLVLLFSLTSMFSFTGCGGPETKSVTEGLPVSEVEAYEARLKEMEAKAADEMADDVE